MNEFGSKSAGLCLLAALLLSLAAGCGGTDKRQFGEAADPNAAKVTLSELVAKPEAYEGKTVVVDGKIAGGCSDSCLLFKDKFELIEAESPPPGIARLKKGTPIRLYGLVKVQRSDAGGKSAPPETTVRIAAKGVEVLK